MTTARKALERVGHGAGLAFALLVPTGAVAALAMHAWRAAEVPTQGDWARAAAFVRTAWRPGDRVAFSPGWAQEGRGLFHGLRAIPQERWGEDEVGGARRLWLVASFGGGVPDWLGPRTQATTARTFGELRVLRLDLTPTARPLYDFVAGIGGADVSLRFPNRTLACPRRGNAHDCTEGRWPWRRVDSRLLIIGGSARRCVFAHPTTGATLTLRYPAVRIGRTLTISHGIADPVAQGGAPVRLEVRVGDRTLPAIVHGPGRGWRRTRLHTGSWRGQTLPVTFAVTTPRDGARHFCFSAEALP